MVRVRCNDSIVFSNELNELSLYLIPPIYDGLVKEDPDNQTPNALNELHFDLYLLWYYFSNNVDMRPSPTNQRWAFLFGLQESIFMTRNMVTAYEDLLTDHPIIRFTNIARLRRFDICEDTKHATTWADFLARIVNKAFALAPLQADDEQLKKKILQILTDAQKGRGSVA